jgi:peptidoglycan/LPS O-acetylase OafA/YrhL
MGVRTPDEAIATRDNAFDLLRLLAAATVVFSHSYPLVGSADPVHALLDLQLGTVGVFILFSLSGYLLTASITGDDRLGPFWARRALRLMPGLIVSVVLTAFVLGPIVTALPLHTYLTSPKPYLYVAKQSVFETFSPHLPGVFVHNPFPNVVNGSLWTLPVEVCCYAALALGSLVGALRRRWPLVAVVGIVGLVVLVVAPPDSPHGITPSGIKELANALRPCGCFATGALLWLARDAVPRRWALVVLSIALVCIPVPSGVHSAIDIVVLPYAVVAIGTMRPGALRRLLAPGDVSYGVYIYSFPIQQVLALEISSLTPLGMLALSAPLSWLAGVASWRLVERPALRLRRRVPGHTVRAAGARAGAQPVVEGVGPREAV